MSRTVDRRPENKTGAMITGDDPTEGWTDAGRRPGRGNGAGGRGRGRGRASRESGPSAASPQPSKWRHPGGLPLSEVEVGSCYDGVVTNCSPFGIFVDFGAIKDGLVRLPPRLQGRGPKRGTALRGLRVTSCDPSTERVVLEVDAASLQRLDRKLLPRSSRSNSRGGDRSSSEAPGSGEWSSGSGRRATSSQQDRAGSQRQRRQYTNEAQRVPLEELKQGSIVEATVKNVGPFGVFLDIGAASDARLRVPTREGRRLFRRGDIVPGCHIDWVDPGLRRIQVSLPDDSVGRSMEEPPPASSRPSHAEVGNSADQRSRAASGSALRRQSPLRGPASVPLEGSIVNGYVRNCSAAGVFVDIGWAQDARLDVPQDMARQFQSGDEVVGMRIEHVDVNTCRITASIDEPELAVTYGQESATAPRVAFAQESHLEQMPEQRSTERVARPKPALESAGQRPKPAARDVPVHRVGDVLDGTVIRVSPSGCFVDVGDIMNARLDVTRELAKQFRKGDRVLGMRVERIARYNGEVTVSLEDPWLEDEQDQAVYHEMSAKLTPSQVQSQKTLRWERTQTNVFDNMDKRPARTSATPTAWPRDASTFSSRRVRSPDDLQAGMQVEGMVTRISPAGVFVDFGASCQGRLRIARRDMDRFQVGDQVEGLVIECIDLEQDEAVLALGSRGQSTNAASHGWGQISQLPSSHSGWSSGWQAAGNQSWSW